MLALEDFTTVAAGTTVLAEGEVRACPRCGRNGVEHRLDDQVAYFVHRQSSELMCDGLLVDPYDLCYIPASLEKPH